MGVEHIAQRVLCAGYTNNLSVDTPSISPLYMEKSKTIHLSLNLPKMTPSVQRSCRFEFFISSLSHHLSFFLPTSIFTSALLTSYALRITFWEANASTLFLFPLHTFVSFQPAFQKVIITFQVPSQKFTELCCFHRKAEQRGRIIPHPAGHAAFNAVQDATGFWGCKHMLLGHVQLFIH